MGYELRRELADTLPEGLSSGERLVALELADQANDRTRVAYGHNLLALVARRCGFANEKQVGKVLGKLAKRGIEFRVQIVKDGAPLVDQRGRPVFAYDGRETTYRIPTFGRPVPPRREEVPPPEVPPPGEHFSTEDDREVSHPGDLSLVVVSQAGEHFSTEAAPEPPSAPPSGRPPNGSGPPPGSKWSPAGVQVVPPAGDPSPHFPSGTPQDQSTRARNRQGARWLNRVYRLTDEEAAAVIEVVRSRSPRPIGNLVRYFESMQTAPDGSARTDLLDVVEAVVAPPAPPPDAEDDQAEDPPPHLTAVPTPAHRTAREAIAAANPDRPQQLPLMTAVPDPPEPVEVDERGLPAVVDRAVTRARLEEIRIAARARTRKAQ